MTLRTTIRFASATLAGALAAAACTSSSRSPAPPAFSTRDGVPILSIAADWDDADAAVLASVEKIEAIVTRTNVRSETEREYLLRRTTGERGQLTLRRADPGNLGDLAPITMTCTLGGAGDPAREQKLMAAVAARLEQLKGVDYAPVP